MVLHRLPGESSVVCEGEAQSFARGMLSRLPGGCSVVCQGEAQSFVRGMLSGVSRFILWVERPETRGPAPPLGLTSRHLFPQPY